MCLENEILYNASYPLSAEAQRNDFVIPIGKAKIEREGTHVTIVAFSRMVQTSLDAAALLEKEGISAGTAFFFLWLQVQSCS